LHGDIHGCGKILHEADLANPVDKRFATEDIAEKLGRVGETLLGFGMILSILVVRRAEVFIGQDLVCLADGLELLVRSGVVGVLVYATQVRPDVYSPRAIERCRKAALVAGMDAPGWWMMASFR
jgi:hypothetical protein